MSNRSTDRVEPSSASNIVRPSPANDASAELIRTPLAQRTSESRTVEGRRLCAHNHRGRRRSYFNNFAMLRHEQPNDHVAFQHSRFNHLIWSTEQTMFGAQTQDATAAEIHHRARPLHFEPAIRKRLDALGTVLLFEFALVVSNLYPCTLFKQHACRV